MSEEKKKALIDLAKTMKGFKSWWAGDPRVEPYMIKVGQALDRSGLTGDARTDVYNRAYEAVYQAIIDADKLRSVSNVLAQKPHEEGASE